MRLSAHASAECARRELLLAAVREIHAPSIAHGDWESQDRVRSLPLSQPSEGRHAVGDGLLRLRHLAEAVYAFCGVGRDRADYRNVCDLHGFSGRARRELEDARGSLDHCPVCVALASAEMCEGRARYRLVQHLTRIRITD